MKNQYEMKTEDFLIVEMWAKYKRYWPYLFLSVILCCGLAQLRIWTTPKSYRRTASVMINERWNTMDVTAVFDEKVVLNMSSSVKNEVEAFRSPTLVQEVVRRLNLTVDYTYQKKLQTTDLYSRSPIKAIFPTSFDEESFSFRVELLGDSLIILSGFEQKDLSIQGRLNDTIHTPAGKIVIVPTVHYGMHGDISSIEVSKSSVMDATQNFGGKLGTSLASRENSIVVLEFTDTNTSRAEDFLNMLINVYNEHWLFERNRIVLSASQLLDERLPKILEELRMIEDRLEQYKRQNKLTTNVQSAASFYMKDASDYTGKILETTTQISCAQLIKDYLAKNNNLKSVLPSNSGLTNIAIENDIKQYNELLRRRDGLLTNTSENNHVIIGYNQQLSSMRQAITQAVDNLIGTLEVR